MIPEGIEILRGKKKSFENTLFYLGLCCEKNDPRGYGCGFDGLCHRLCEQRDRDWEWTGGDLSKQTQAQSKGTQVRPKESDWLDASSPYLKLRSATILDRIDGNY